MIEGNGGRLCEEEGPWLIGLRCCLRHARWGGGLQRPPPMPPLSNRTRTRLPVRPCSVTTICCASYSRVWISAGSNDEITIVVFLDAVRPYPRGFRLSYLFMSVSIVVLEVVFHAISAPLGTHDILILAALCALLSVAPWLGITGDLLYVAVFAAMGAFSSSLAFPVLGVFLVAAVWLRLRCYSLATFC